jgi:hypothetical protein
LVEFSGRKLDGKKEKSSEKIDFCSELLISKSGYQIIGK